MTSHENVLDLVVLVADKNMEFTVRGLLERPSAIQIRSISFNIYRHPENDPGCRIRSHELLRTLQNDFTHALVLFDREGCGAERKSRESLEDEVQQRLSASGWKDRSAVIVFDPELEIWVWSDSPHVGTILGWDDARTDLRQWLEEQGFLRPGGIKPDRPKEAMQEALRFVKRPWSSSIHHQLAKRVSVKRCVDPAFGKFRATLQQWFTQ